jgi:5'-3' exonuclease
MTAERMNVHLVDGTYELFRSFYGAPSKIAPDGREVGATLGFARGLLGLLETPGVTHVAVAFDTVIESFRNELFAGYKTGEGIDPALWAQFPLVEQMTEALGVTAWRMLDFEADDALATGAARFSSLPEVARVVLCSPDKDLMQCVRGQDVVCWDRLRDKLYDETAVREKLGVLPASIPDYLALVGDTADGIPGVPRWGARSAASVLARYQHLEAIPRDAAAWDITVRGAAALVSELTSHESEVLLYRRLATLRSDVPLAEGLLELEWRGARRRDLEALCRDLGDERLPGRPGRFRDD